MFEFHCGSTCKGAAALVGFAGLVCVAALLLFALWRIACPLVGAPHEDDPDHELPHAVG